jgi:hypothetical protein
MAETKRGSTPLRKNDRLEMLLHGINDDFRTRPVAGYTIEKFANSTSDMEMTTETTEVQWN